MHPITRSSEIIVDGVVSLLPCSFGANLRTVIADESIMKKQIPRSILRHGRSGQVSGDVGRVRIVAGCPNIIDIEITRQRTEDVIVTEALRIRAGLRVIAVASIARLDLTLASATLEETVVGRSNLRAGHEGVVWV